MEDRVFSLTEIGSCFSERTDPVALVIGPTGVGLSSACAEEDEDGLRAFCCGHLNNRMAAILIPMRRGPSAATGLTVSTGGSLNGPLGLTVAPNGHILVVNGNDGFITEITPRGKQLAKVFLDNTGTPPGSGTLFGVTFDPQHGALFVDDGGNTLNSLN